MKQLRRFLPLALLSIIVMMFVHAFNYTPVIAQGPSTGTPSATNADLLAFSVGGGPNNVLQFWLANPDGSGARNITDGVTLVFPGIAWSPDAKQIAYYGVRYGKLGVYIFDFSLGDSKQVVLKDQQTPLMSYTVAWSPDGKYIAYMADDGLYVVTPDGKLLNASSSCPRNHFIIRPHGHPIAIRLLM